MDIVFRVLILYLVLMILLRASGRRALSELTGFDLVLLLIVAEVTDNALLGQFSFMQAVLVIVTLFVIDIGFSLWKQKSARVAKYLEGTPVVVVDHGRCLRERMDYLRISEDEVLQAARLHKGLTALEEIRFAVVESSGKISIIPENREKLSPSGAT